MNKLNKLFILSLFENSWFYKKETTRRLKQDQFKKPLIIFLMLVFSQLALAEPVAVLPKDKTATTGDSISIDGSSSFDAEGASLIYRWSIDIAPQAFNSQIDKPTSSSISFNLDTAGFYLIRLIVNNGTENSDPAYMVIRVE